MLSLRARGTLKRPSVVYVVRGVISSSCSMWLDGVCGVLGCESISEAVVLKSSSVYSDKIEED